VTPGAATLLQSAAAKYGVDPALALAVAQQESGLDQAAVSSAGARGVMQLMPATAAEMGVNAADLAGNIEGGVKYLAQLLQKFGDTVLAVAAYNAGPGAVQQYGAVPPYSETQSYVSSVMARVGAYLSPSAAPAGATGDAGDNSSAASAEDQTGGPDLSWVFSLPVSSPDTALPAVVAVGAVLALWFVLR
jgi:hypothetical protein